MLRFGCCLAEFLVLGAGLAMAVDGKLVEADARKSEPPQFERLIPIVIASRARPPTKLDHVEGLELNAWSQGLTQGDLMEHYHRLQAEAKLWEQSLATEESGSERRFVYDRAQGAMVSCVLQLAMETRHLALVTDILSEDPHIYCPLWARTEHTLIRQAGTGAFACYFQAYEKCTDQKVRDFLALRIKAAFAYLLYDVWSRDDAYEVTIPRLRAWYDQHLHELRPVEVYRPMTASRYFWEQGIEPGERMIGLFFQKPAKPWPRGLTNQGNSAVR